MELNIKAGDEIRYTSALGQHLALVKNVRIAPTAKPDHSIAWLDLTVYGYNDRRGSVISIPADTSSLKMFKVEKV